MYITYWYTAFCEIFFILRRKVYRFVVDVKKADHKSMDTKYEARKEINIYTC